MTEKKSKEKQLIENRLQKLINGEIESDNEFVNYAIGELRGCLATKEMLVQKIEETRKSLTQMETRLIEAGAQFDTYANDVVHFDTDCQNIKKKTKESKNEKPVDTN